MKKQLLILTLICFSLISFSQKTETSLILATKNIWRGINFGKSPTAIASLEYSYKNSPVIGFQATKALNGSNKGYGNVSNVYLYKKVKKFTFFLDDYYFFDEDNLNDYFEWSNNRTNHFVELRIKFEHKKIFGIVGQCLYSRYLDFSRQNNMSAIDNFLIFNIHKNQNNHPFFEFGYNRNDHELFYISAVTGYSDLSFYKKAGIVQLAYANTRDVKGFPLTITCCFKS